MNQAFVTACTEGDCESLLRTMAKNSSALFWQTDLELRVTSYAGAALAEPKTFSGPIQGVLIADLFGVEDAEDPVLVAHRRALRGETAWGHWRLAGREVQGCVVPRRDDQKRIIGCLGFAGEITDAEASERRFRQLLEWAPDATVVVNGQGEIVLVNSQAERLFGYTRPELIGQIVEILMPDRHREVHSALREEYAADPGMRPMGALPELWCLHKDGHEFPAEIALSPIDTDAGPVVSVAVRDVTERHRARKELERSLDVQRIIGALLRISLERIPLAQQLQRMLDLLLSVEWSGLEPIGAVYLLEGAPPLLKVGAARGMSAQAFEACWGKCELDHMCRRAAATGRTVFSASAEGCFVQNLQPAPCGQYAIPVVSDGQIQAVISLFVRAGYQRSPERETLLRSAADVLALTINHSHGEQALLESEERFHLAVRGTDAGIWDWDLRTNAVYFSPRWKSMLGYEEHEIKAAYDEWESRVHAEDRERALATLRDYLDGRLADYELEHRLRHKDGTYRWILARGALVRDEHGKPYRMAGSHLDITDRKRDEDALRRREAELLAAQEIQRQLLPSDAPSLPGYEFAGASCPAEFAGGDYFDYLNMPDQSVAVVVGDVSGHGVASALLTAATQARLRSIAETGLPIDEILARVNARLCNDTEDHRFVTLLLARLDPKSRTLTYVNAGHPSGYVLGLDGEVKAELSSGTMPLAISPDTPVPVAGPVVLEPGQVVLLATDGLLDAQSPNGERYGPRRALDLVHANRHRSATEVLECLYEAVAAFCHHRKPLDDVTAVVIKVGPDSGPMAE